MQVTSVPIKFQPLIDELVELSLKAEGHADYPDMSQLEEWLEGDGYEFALKYWKDELVVLDLKKLADSDFSDSVLCDHEGVDEDEIDDSLRVEFARSRIEYEFEPGVETYAYTIHQLPITDSSDRNAILGYKIQQHGQCGSKLHLHGSFQSEKELLENLRLTGHLLQAEIDDISDALILGLWKNG